MGIASASAGSTPIERRVVLADFLGRLPAMAVVRAGAAAVVAAGHLLVFGGYSDEPLCHDLHGISTH